MPVSWSGGLCLFPRSGNIDARLVSSIQWLVTCRGSRDVLQWQRYFLAAGVEHRGAEALPRQRQPTRLLSDQITRPLGQKFSKSLFFVLSPCHPKTSYAPAIADPYSHSRWLQTLMPSRSYHRSSAGPTCCAGPPRATHKQSSTVAASPPAASPSTSPFSTYWA